MTDYASLIRRLRKAAQPCCMAQEERTDSEALFEEAAQALAELLTRANQCATTNNWTCPATERTP